MRITWLGHASFRIETGEQVLLIDPWLADNPLFPEERKHEAVVGATHILLTHGHADHASEAPQLAHELWIPVIAVHELAQWIELNFGVMSIGMGVGGTITVGDVSITLVAASHSSSIDSENPPVNVGCACGFMIAAEGHVVYVSGDTDIMADMAWMGDLHKPDIGILCAGGHYTMDMKRAAYAAQRYFDFSTVIPCHYRTFPHLAQSAAELVSALPGVNVLEPEVMVPIELSSRELEP